MKYLTYVMEKLSSGDLLVLRAQTSVAPFCFSLILCISCAKSDFHVNESPTFISIDYFVQPIPSPRTQTVTDTTHAVQPEPGERFFTVTAQHRWSQ